MARKVTIPDTAFINYHSSSTFRIYLHQPFSFCIFNLDLCFQTLLSATKSHRKNQIELVQNVLHAEEEKRRRERELFHITAVPLLSRASQEPGLFVLGGVAGDDHVECKLILPFR